MFSLRCSVVKSSKSYCRSLSNSTIISSNRSMIDWNNTTIDSIVDNKSNSLDTVRDMYEFSLRSLRLHNRMLSYGQSTLCEEDDASLLVLNSLSLPLLGSSMTKNNFILDDGIKKYSSRILTRSNKVDIIKKLQQRIVNKTPIAYLVNGCYQQGEYFYVNNNVIIPRSFIGEILADKNINELINIKSIENVCDVCTGSGALAILSKKYLHNVKKVHAIDICPLAIEVAKTNVKNKNLHKIINVYQSDLFNNINDNHKYDLILCNPPYVDNKAMKKLPPEYSHEPKISLVGGTSGLDIIERLIKSILPFLKNDDSGLLLEIGRTQQQLQKRFPEFCEKATWLSTTYSDDEVLYITKKDILSSNKMSI